MSCRMSRLMSCRICLPATRQRLRPDSIVRSYRSLDGLLRVLVLHTAKVVHRGAVFVLDFVVVDETGQPPLLGLPSCDELNLIRRVDTIQSPVDSTAANCCGLYGYFHGIR